MKKLAILLIIGAIGFGVAGCGQSAEQKHAEQVKITKKKAAEKEKEKREEKKDRAKIKRGEKSLTSDLALAFAAAQDPRGSDIRHVEISTGYVTVVIAGSSVDAESKQMAKIVCGVLISWFIDTDEKYANYGYVELMSGDRVGECEIGKVKIED